MAKALLSEYLHNLLDHSQIPVSGVLSATYTSGMSGQFNGSGTGMNPLTISVTGTSATHFDPSGYIVYDRVFYDDATTRGTVKSNAPESLPTNEDWATQLNFIPNVFTTYAFRGTATPATADVLNIQTQFPHKIKRGSDVEFHIHLSTCADPGTGTSAVFALDYYWSNLVNDSFSAQSGSISAVHEVPSGSYQSMIMSLGTIPGSGVSTVKTISSLILGKLSRRFGHPSDNCTESLFLIDSDFHYQADTPGSRVITGK